MRISALIALLPLIFSCASIGEAVVQKYREDGLPMWVENRFTNPSGYWAGFNDEGGYYASGKAKYGDAQSSTAAAELDAKANLCDFVARSEEHTSELQSPPYIWNSESRQIGFGRRNSPRTDVRLRKEREKNIQEMKKR